MQPLLYAYNRPNHQWKQDYVGDFLAIVTDIATICLLAGLAIRIV